MKTETLNNKISVTELETLINTLAHTPPMGKPQSVVHTLADTLAKIKSQKLSDLNATGRNTALADSWCYTNRCGS